MRKSGNRQEMEQYRRQLLCPNCQDYMKPPILKCETNHSLCWVCRAKSSTCPICSKNFTNERNLPLETLANNMTLLSIKSPTEVYVKPKIKCPIASCTWQGGPEQLSEHWSSKKIALKSYKEENVCQTTIKDKYTYYTNKVEVYGEIFFFKCTGNNGNFYWAMQYVGDSSLAEKYYYEIEIFKRGRWNYRFVLSSYCQAISLSNEELFKEGVCTFTPIALLDPYMDESKLLVYYLRVKCVDSSNDQKRSQEINKLLNRRDRSKARPPRK